jgi:hypothetical protein
VSPIVTVIGGALLLFLHADRMAHRLSAINKMMVSFILRCLSLRIYSKLIGRGIRQIGLPVGQTQAVRGITAVDRLAAERTGD